jgi:hypothetical protein
VAGHIDSGAGKMMLDGFGFGYTHKQDKAKSYPAIWGRQASRRTLGLLLHG